MYKFPLTSSIFFWKKFTLKLIDIEHIEFTVHINITFIKHFFNIYVHHTYVLIGVHFVKHVHCLRWVCVFFFESSIKRWYAYFFLNTNDTLRWFELKWVGFQEMHIQFGEK